MLKGTKRARIALFSVYLVNFEEKLTAKLELMFNTLPLLAAPRILGQSGSGPSLRCDLQILKESF